MFYPPALGSFSLFFCCCSDANFPTVRSTTFFFFLFLPLSLSSPTAPDVSVFGEVVGDAFALAIVGYAISISLGKTFALKHGYKVDSNQVRLVEHVQVL